MNKLKIVATTGYYLSATFFLVLGVIYSLSKRIMPYHLEAMGKTWDELSNGMQWATLNFVRSVGAGFISAAIAMFFLLIVPFKQLKLWAYIAIFSISITQLGLVFIRTLSIKSHTSAEPPVIGLVAAILILLISFICSVIGYMVDKKIIF